MLTQIRRDGRKLEIHYFDSWYWIWEKGVVAMAEVNHVNGTHQLDVYNPPHSDMVDVQNIATKNWHISRMLKDNFRYKATLILGILILTKTHNLINQTVPTPRQCFQIGPMQRPIQFKTFHVPFIPFYSTLISHTFERNNRVSNGKHILSLFIDHNLYAWRSRSTALAGPHPWSYLRDLGSESWLLRHLHSKACLGYSQWCHYGEREGGKSGEQTELGTLKLCQLLVRW